MSWAQLDDRFPEHRKFVRLRMRGLEGLAAIGLWSQCLAWAHLYNRTLPPDQQGFIPPEVVWLYAKDSGPQLAALLAEVPPGAKAGLWEPIDDGWRIHDFRYWQQLHIREAQVKAGKAAARKRWGIPEGQEPLFDDASSQVNRSPNGSPTESVMRNPMPPNPNPNLKDQSQNTWSSDADRFDEFWSIYPRKVAKQAARRAWDKAMTRAGPDEVIEGARRYASAREYADPKYTKHPATWLNGGCWEDEDSAAAVRAPWEGPEEVPPEW